MTINGTKLVICDLANFSQKESLFRNAQIVCWDNIDTEKNIYSIVDKVNEKKEEYREYFIEVVDEIGLEISNESQVPRINGLSIWWLNQFAEKDFDKLEDITLLFKIWALRDLLRENIKPSQNQMILIRAKCSKLRECISMVCENLELQYEIVENKTYRFTQKSLNLNVLRALGSILWRTISRLSLISRKPISVNSTEKRISFISYFPNIDLGAANSGKFVSQYWGKLHQCLSENNSYIDWIFIFSPNKQCPSSREYNNFLNLFSDYAKVNQLNQRFIPIEAYLNLKGIIQVALQYFYLLFHSRSIVRSIEKIICSKNPEIWFLFRNKILDSVTGVNAIQALTQLKAFENMSIENSKFTVKYFYLREGQVWERSLVHASKAWSQARVYGVVHSKIRHFDFRQFHSRKYWQGQGEKYSCPEPDQILVNGANAKKNMIQQGISIRVLCEVEALRYQYLLNMNVNKQKTNSTMLVACDLSNDITRRILEILMDALSKNLRLEKVLVKLHPFSSIDNLSTLQSDKRVQITNMPIKDLLGNVSVVLCSNRTTVALEAAYLGINTVIAIPSSGLNLSASHELPGAFYVNNGNELRDAIGSDKNLILPANYFYLDNTLSRWRELLTVGCAL